MKVGDFVSFREVNNARGYPATGEVIEVSEDKATVRAFGLYGPGTETTVNDVPLEELKHECG